MSPRCPHLDADEGALAADDLGEGTPIVRLLVEGLVEEDDPTDARVHPAVGGEEQLPVPAPVLFRVLRSHRAQALGDAACSRSSINQSLPVQTSIDQ